MATLGSPTTTQSNPSTLGPVASPLGPGIAGGFALALTVWVAWLLTHLPWMSEAFGITERHAVPTILAAWFIASFLLGRGVGLKRAPLVGLIAGVVSALVGLLILGSRLTEIPAESAAASADPLVRSQFVPNAGLIALGFLGLGAIIGTIGAFAGSLTRPAGPRTEPNWLGRMGIITLLAAAPLLFVGGLVTSTNSGMAVPDWPGTYGSNMFLYPLGPRFAALEGKQPYADIFLEHSHRLLGALLGLNAMVLMIWTLLKEPRRWVKVWAVATFLLICFQGAIGGLRVLEGSLDLEQDNVWLSAFHGVSAQVTFAAIVSLAMYLSSTYQSLNVTSSDATQPPVHDKTRILKAMSTGAMHALWPQLVFGAMYRHAGSAHALYTHMAFAFVVTGLAIVAGMIAIGDSTTNTGAAAVASPAKPSANSSARRWLALLGYAIVLCVGLQFILGWAAFATHSGREAASIGEALVRTAHQANGAALLGLTTALALLARQAWRAAGKPGRGHVSA
jgi:cytochrome c oxidase assembly protein subunit 15